MHPIKELAEKKLRQAGVQGDISLSAPPKSEMGDLAFACFDLAKEQKTSPAEAAKELAKKISSDSLIEKVEATGPYVNFHLSAGKVATMILLSKTKRKKTGKKIMVEYSQPNTHKEFHVGHLRNACIGGSVVELLKGAGNKVIAANYIGDIGAHVAKCLWYVQKYKIGEMPKENLGAWVGKMYTQATKILEESPSYKDEVDGVLRKLESRDREWISLWKKTRAASMEEFNRIYKLLGNKFDVWFFESEEEGRGKDIVSDLLKKGVARKGEGGAVIVDLSEFGLDIFLLLKSDGSSLYSTKDLALAEKKFKKYRIDSSIVVIDTRQSFYFKQLFKTLELAGWKKQLFCLTYEFVRLPEGAMSSRQGNVVLFEDIYSDVLAAVRSEVEARHGDWDTNKIEDAARIIALAAIKFGMIKHPTDKVIEFDVKEAMSFDGYTGPYILYTVARINSMFRRIGKQSIRAKEEILLLTNSEEKNLILKLSEFEEVLDSAANKLDPSVVARFAFDLAKQYNDFYSKHSVLNAASKDLVTARLLLSQSIRQALKEACSKLLIETVEEM